MEHVHPFVLKIAFNAYVLLPLFLGLVAGFCILVTTLRRTLTPGIAASLSGLGGVVVLGLVITGAAHRHGEGHRAVEPPAAGSAEGQKALERQLENVWDMNQHLRARILDLERMNRGETSTGRATKGKPSESLPPPGAPSTGASSEAAPPAGGPKATESESTPPSPSAAPKDQ